MKSIFLSTLLLGSLAFTSCTKEWVCNCSQPDINGGEARTWSYEIDNDKAKEAKEQCEGENDNSSYGIVCAISKR